MNTQYESTNIFERWEELLLTFLNSSFERLHSSSPSTSHSLEVGSKLASGNSFFAQFAQWATCRRSQRVGSVGIFNLSCSFRKEEQTIHRVTVSSLFTAVDELLVFGVDGFFLVLFVWLGGVSLGLASGEDKKPPSLLSLNERAGMPIARESFPSPASPSFAGGPSCNESSIWAPAIASSEGLRTSMMLIFLTFLPWSLTSSLIWTFICTGPSPWIHWSTNVESACSGWVSKRRKNV